MSPSLPLPAQSLATEARPGVPFGGLGTGGFRIGKDGRFGHATFNNNPTPLDEAMRGCFIAFRFARGADSAAFRLDEIPDVRFDGGFPVAQWTAERPGLPARFVLRAFSALVPGDLKNSSLPVALLVCSAENTGKEAAEAAIALSWENLLGVGIGSTGPFRDRTGATVETLEPREGLFGLVFEAPPLPAVPPADRLPYNARGDYAVLVQASSEEWSVTTAGWNALEFPPAWWRSFETAARVEGRASEGREKTSHPAGVLCVRLPLGPGEKQEVAFAVAWNTPRHYTLAGDEYGHFHSKSFPDAVAAGRYALENRLVLEALTGELLAGLQRSDLPLWLVRRLADETSLLATHAVLTRDSSLSGTDPGPALFGMIGSLSDSLAPLGALSRRHLVQPLLSVFFSGLDGDELRTAARAQRADGAFPEHYGSFRAGFPGEPASGGEAPANEGATEGFLFGVLHHYQATGDQRFLDRLFPATKRAAQWLLGLPPARTARAEIRRLAAVAAASRLASGVGDRAFSEVCENALDGHKLALLGRFWNGEFIGQSAEKKRVLDLAVLEGAVLGDWLDLGEIVPVPERLATEHALLKYGLAVQGTAPPSAVDTQAGSPTERECTPAMALAAFAASLLRISPRQGLASARRTLDAIRASSAGEWLPPTTLDSQSGAVLRDERYPEAPSWRLLASLLGFTVNAAEQRIVLRPALAEGQTEFRAPLFAAAFWGWMTYRASKTESRLTLRLDRILSRPRLPRPSEIPSPGNVVQPVAFLVRQIVFPGRGGQVTGVTAAYGRAPAPGRLGADAGGRPVYTFDPPLRLTPGREIELRWPTTP